MKGSKPNKDEIINIDNVDFAKLILDTRNKKNLTQKQFAELIGVSNRTVSNWEKGISVPDVIVIQNMCKKLKISPNSLLYAKPSLKDHMETGKKSFKSMVSFIFKNIFMIIFLIAFVLLLIYFVNNFNSVSIYSIRIYEDNNIQIERGYLINSKNEHLLILDNISVSDIDVEIENINLVLYTIVNGSKIVVYEIANLDDIYIDEFNFNEYLEKDILFAIETNLYMDITINDKDIYSAKIDFYNNFTNNKLVYNKSNYANYHEYSNSVDIANKLIALGYSYDEGNEVYTKNDNGKDIFVKNNDKSIQINRYKNNLIYNTKYFINRQSIEYAVYNKNGKEINHIRYFVDDKSIICVLGECKNYMNDIDYILGVYKEIFADE